jgi:hypothetical protein
MRDLPVDDEAHLLLSCSATTVVRQERKLAPAIDVVAGPHAAMMFAGWRYPCTIA